MKWGISGDRGESTQLRKERSSRPPERQEHLGGPCYPMSGVDPTGQKLGAPLSQLHAGRPAAQTNSRVISGIPGPGVLSWVPHLFRVKRHAVTSSQSQVNKCWTELKPMVGPSLDRKAQRCARETKVPFRTSAVVNQPFVMNGLLRTSWPAFCLTPFRRSSGTSTMFQEGSWYWGWTQEWDSVLVLIWRVARVNLPVSYLWTLRHSIWEATFSFWLWVKTTIQNAEPSG